MNIAAPPLIDSIISNARQLNLFTEANSDFPIFHFQQMGARADIPAHLNLYKRVQELSEQIQQYCGQQRQGRGRGSAIALLGMSQGLKRELEGSPYNLIGTIAPALKQIADFGRTLRPSAPALPLPVVQEVQPAPIEEPPQSPGPPPDDLDENLWQAIVDENTAQIISDRDNLIFHCQSERLEIVDSICVQLFANPNPWLSECEQSSPVFFETFPALIEGRLMQLSGSYDEYLAKHPYAASLTRGHYQQIRALSFEQLANELGNVFDLSKELSPLMVKLVCIGKAQRLDNERLIYLGLTRREKIIELSALAREIRSLTNVQLHEAIVRAQESDSAAFISAALGQRIMDISNEDLNELVPWLAGRGKIQLLTQIFTNRSRDIEKDTYFEAIANAKDWKHQETYDFLFTNYPHRQPGAAKELLTAFSFYGNGEGVAHLLSDRYPQGFSADTIDHAFKAALDKHQYACMAAFLNAGVSPHDETLNAAFEDLCQNDRFEALLPFLKPEIVVRIPNARTLLQETFTRNCESGNFSILPFFLDPQAAVFIDRNCAFVFLENLLYSKEWEESEPLLKAFAPSAIFNQLEFGDLYAIIREASVLGKRKFANFLLNTTKGEAIPKEKFEELLINVAVSKKWASLLSLLNHSRSQRVSGATLSQLLLRPPADNLPVELVERILSRNDPQDPIPNDDLITAFKVAVQTENLATIRELRRHPRFPSLSVEELEPLLAEHHANDGAISELLFFPAALKIGANTISQIFYHSAKAGKTQVLDIPFENLARVSDERLERALFAALRHNQIPAARTIYSKRGFPAANEQSLRDCALQAATSGNTEILQFLFHCFSPQMTPQLTQEAHTIAEQRGHFETSTYLWSRLWHGFINRTEPPKENHPKHPIKQKDSRPAPAKKVRLTE
ncbi:MAG: hypothetical protein K1X28_08315 [Parachlamydiales bacterium]|nr:hypothetical protein [Parachlamydiales bacterium]